jgi:hypothetical protein
MKWLTVLRARPARTFQRNTDFENVRYAPLMLRKNEAAEGVAPVSANRCIGGNPFIVLAHTDGENDFASCHIRNSISLTIRRTRRMICASHQGTEQAPAKRVSLDAAPHGTGATQAVVPMAEPCQRRSADG